MKIVALHTDFRIYWPARLNALKEALNNRGDTLDVIEIAGLGSPYAFASKESVSNACWHILFPDKRPEDISGILIKPKLFNLLNKINPDIIISGAIAFSSGALAVQWGLKHNRRIIIFDDAKLDAVPRRGITNFIKKAVYSGVDGMFYPASDWIETGNFWGFDKNRMSFGVDVVDNDFWSASLNGDNNYGDYFIAVGRQIPKKNFLGILRAYKKYVAELGNNAYNLLLIGEGEQHEKLLNYISTNGLKGNVSLLPFLSQNELKVLYHNAKALCCNSDNTETWGLVINEAMACGCPVFATHQCGASSSLIKDDINGYTFNCNDVEQLSSIMIDFTKLSLNEQIKMREASKAIIKDWGLSKFTKGCLELIDGISNKIKRKPKLLHQLICLNWNGRYNPV